MKARLLLAGLAVATTVAAAPTSSPTVNLGPATVVMREGAVTYADGRRVDVVLAPRWTIDGYRSACEMLQGVDLTTTDGQTYICEDIEQ